MTNVVNIYRLPVGWQRDPQYVYIGRPGKGVPGPWGNPFRLVSGNGRGATLERYRRWLIRRLWDEPDFRAEVAGLSGKTLVCFCKPNTCHGDILAEAADLLVDLDNEEEMSWALEELGDVEDEEDEEEADAED